MKRCGSLMVRDTQSHQPHSVNTHIYTLIHTEQTFTVGCAPETIRRTNLGTLQEGALVNLERCVYV